MGIGRSSIGSVSIGSMGIGRSSIGSVSVVDRGGVGGSGHNSNIVGVSSSIGIVDGESSSDLSNGVSISIRVSLALAIVVSSISVDSCGGNNTGVHGRSSNNSRVSSRSSNMVSVAKMSNTSIANMSSIGTVTNSSNTTDNSIRIVNTSYYSSIGKARCNLPDSVGVTVSNHGSSGQKDKCKSSHFDNAEQS